MLWPQAPVKTCRYHQPAILQQRERWVDEGLSSKGTSQLSSRAPPPVLAQSCTQIFAHETHMACALSFKGISTSK